MKKSKLISFIIGLVSILISFISILVLDVPTIKSKIVKFESTYNETTVTLEGTYYDVKDATHAVLICPGYSCDRQKWRPFADLFVSNGCSTMIFDYSGQGASTYTIGFDNAKTDNISKEIDDAIVKLHELSNVSYENIILVGHSMGGRSILRLLYDYNDPTAETLVNKKPISNVILLSPEVNYNYNAQASLFAGTSDESQLPWKDYNASYTTGCNVYLFGSTADDIVSDEDIIAISKRLGVTTNYENNKAFIESSVNSVGSTITVGIVNGVLHSYQMYSFQFAKMVNNALTNITNNTSTYNPYKMLLVYVGWIFGLLGVGFLLYSLNKDNTWKHEDNIPELIDAKAFLIRKSILWSLGIVFAFLVCCITVVMPFGSPVMNSPYMCFIAGYGITMLIFYSKGKFKGTSGKLPRIGFKTNNNVKEILISISIAIAVCFFVWFVLNGTMYRLIPFNFRLFWLLFATVVMSLGYYISSVETDMLNNANASFKVKFLYNLIQYVPLFLLVIFYLILKSYSGLIGQVQNIILMYLFCIPLGNFIKKKTNNRLIGAILTAFLFQAIMITSAALISLF